MDDQASKINLLNKYLKTKLLKLNFFNSDNRLVEITMIFHVLKNRQAYQDAMLGNDNAGVPSNWTSTMKKIRDNIVVCNYKFLRDMSKNATDDSWIITGLNHWLPSEYEDQQQQQQQQT
mgnify:CR=1 FL=1